MRAFDNLTSNASLNATIKRTSDLGAGLRTLSGVMGSAQEWLSSGSSRHFSLSRLAEIRIESKSMKTAIDSGLSLALEEPQVLGEH